VDKLETPRPALAPASAARERTTQASTQQSIQSKDSTKRARDRNLGREEFLIPASEAPSFAS
jgi:hypothetical protein